MADQYNDQPRHRHPDTQHDQFEARNDGQYGEGSDHYGSRDRSGRFDERGYGRSDDRYEGDWGRARHDRDDTRSYPQDRDRLREGGRHGSESSRYDDDARWGTMEGREWGAERHNRMGGGRSGRNNPDPVPPMQGRGRSRGGYDDYGGSGYRDDYDARGYGGRGYRGGRDRDRGFFDKAGDEVQSWFGDDDAERRRNRDHRQDSRENHRGRGPANYKRSNERLMEDACERLTHDPRIDARQINVTAKDNEITLDGHVWSRAEKREAEDCVHEISGVKHVQNNLRIATSDEDMDSGNRSGKTATRTK
ncbi:MAG: SWFGD domain-containing protein [Erythrobacter sp.]|jgi:osmotically-inducible protein OsmY|nr:SWFGD domain-containing protein [Erythrobacter sp.]